ncbi:MAG TPA: flavodoxin domain-containing protein [Thermoanaerobaculia bacterium]|nr:flavodoxin domain-containing protein [Thermoanaerobaculia bacterium]
MKMLILYNSRYGQTARIADRISEIARKELVDARACPIGACPEDVELEKYEAIVIAGPVYYGKFRKPLVRFVKQHLQSLAACHSALVAVSLSAKFNRDEAEGHVRTLIADTGWMPETFTCVGGAETFTQYGFFTGYIMRKIAREQGRGGDFKQDREYTDWDALDQFTREFVAKVGTVTASVAAVKP